MALNSSDENFSNSQESTKRWIINRQNDNNSDSKENNPVYHDDVGDDGAPETKDTHSGEKYHKGGLAHSLHGNIYQLKLQMLFLHRALIKDYDFQLGTEVEEAGKFDDIVFIYKRKNVSAKPEIRFLQAKHRQNKSNNITASDLLTVNHKNDFSLRKYFISYRLIKTNPKFNKCKLKDLILYTNIDFHRIDLEKSLIKLKQIEEEDDILNVTIPSKDIKHFKVLVPEGHVLYEILKETSDLHILANTLKQHMIKNKPLRLDTDIFKHYHNALMNKVFQRSGRSYAKFRHEFLTGEGLTEDVSIFRSTFQSSFGLDDGKFQTELRDKEIQVSKKFSQVFDPRPIITDSKELAKYMTNIIMEGNNENVITINRKSDNIIDSNIDMLAYHVLVQVENENGLVRFSKAFLADGDDHNLNGNLIDFKDNLKSMLLVHGIEFQTVVQYKFKIGEFHTCEETPEGLVKYPKTELPNDVIEDAEVDEFLDKLVFAVNQPNEVELGDIITEELGESSTFNLLDANLVSNTFQNHLLNWFKEIRPEKCKEGTWLDNRSGEEILNSIRLKIEGLVTIGISETYPQMLATYCIRFHKNKISEILKKFLFHGDESKKILCIINPKQTMLTVLNIYDFLETLKQQDDLSLLKKHDSYIFVQLETLLREKIQTYLLDAFKSEHNYNLLIIDCMSVGPQNNLDINQLAKKLTYSLLNTNKKIIFITKDKNNVVGKFPEDLKLIVKDNTTFSDLTIETKKMLLQKQVLFQGHMVCLNELIDQLDEEVENVIDVRIVNKLLNNEKVTIGIKLKGLGEINDYYIHRKFRSIVFSKEQIQKYLQEKGVDADLFLVSGADSGLKHINIFEHSNTVTAEKRFAELQDKYADFNIHWLESDSQALYWNKSFGKVMNLIPYMTKQKMHKSNRLTLKHLTAETKLFQKHEGCDKTVIISATAGMGKSTVLTHISTELKNDPSIWVIRVNFIDHTDVLNKIKNKSLRFRSENVVDFVFDQFMPYPERSKLEKKLFKHFLKQHEKIVFLFDGFDEISPTYKDIVIDLLQSLQKFNVRNIFVTTRPNVQDNLERALGVFSYLLEPFSNDDQIQFLEKIWSKKLQLKNVDANKLKIYVQSTIKQISKYINDKEQEFVSIPLQMMMLAEVFQENKIGQLSTWQGCKEFIESEREIPDIQKEFALVKLYDYFVERKFYDFYLKEKQGRILTKVGEIQSANKEFKLFKKEMGLFALKLLLCDDLKQLLLGAEIVEINILIEEFKNGNHNNGIVDEIIDGKPHFIHRSFAEYFASFPVAMKIVEAPSKTLRCINDVLLNISPIFVRSMIDHLDGKQELISASLQKPLLHFVITDNYCLNFLKVLLHSNHNGWHKKLDAFGKSPLHYAVELELPDAVDLLLNVADDIYETEILRHGSFKKPEYANSSLVKFINLQDNESKTALYYAIQKNNFDVAFTLLLKGASISSIKDDNINVLINHMLALKNVDILNNGIIGVYANQDNKYRPIQEKLFLRAPGVFNKLSLYEQSRILSYFFSHARIQVIDALLKTVSDVEERNRILKKDDNGSTPLDRVLGSNDISDHEMLEVTKYLLENNGLTSRSGYDYEDSSDFKPILFAAADRGHLKTLKYYLNQQNCNENHNLLYIACRSNQEVIVKYLYENIKDHTSFLYEGNTALHYACEKGTKLEIIQYLIQKSDINARNNDGETPLLLYIKYNRRLTVIKYLIHEGADINLEDKFGNTPLSCAVTSDKDHITFYLLENNARVSTITSKLIKVKIAYFSYPNKINLDFVDKRGYPRLHAAIMSGDFEWAKFLVRRGADVNKLDCNGHAPIYLCSIMNNIAMVELLLQYGAIFDVKNSSNETMIDSHQNDHVDREFSLVRSFSNLIGGSLRAAFNQQSSNLKSTSFKSQNYDKKLLWLFNVLNKLFKSQNLMQDLNKDILGEVSERDIGPYGHFYPDEWDTRNPMIFVLNARNYEGQALLHIAAKTNDEKALRILLRFNQNYLGRKKQNCNPKERYQILKYPDYQPMSIDMTDFQGNAPIHIASEMGYERIVNVLLEEGAIVNGKNLQNKTPKELAICNNHSKIAELLQSVENLFVFIKNHNKLDLENYIKENKYINIKNQSGKTPLHVAASLNEPTITEMLLENGADVTVAEQNKNTPLHTATEKDKINNVQLLLKYGSVYDAINSKGKTPLDLAHGQSRDIVAQVDALFREVQSDKPQNIIDRLINMHKYNRHTISFIINSRDHEGNTLLHYAAEFCEFEIVKFLLENGAIYNVRNEVDEEPIRLTHSQNIRNLLIAVDNMFKNIISVDHGFKTVSIQVIKNVLDDKRKSLLYYARESKESKIIKFLKDKNAYD